MMDWAFQLLAGCFIGFAVTLAVMGRDLKNTRHARSQYFAMLKAMTKK